MTKQTFFLQPFSSNESLTNLHITGNIARYDNQLTINYQLSGDLKTVVISLPSNTPTRKNELWEETCFEFFLGIKDSAQYWEFNLSPSGNWNIYRFDGYRQGMTEETAFSVLPFKVHQSDDLSLVVNIDLSQIIPAKQTLEIAITTVIKHSNDTVTYWALTHCGQEADFHLRDSFMIDL
ncbi:MAG: DOMON-like domain-containing protein [Nostoc sp. LLA-1]|nr:DOMON-like domain-containing protein [Cyanocohniella sp. LLY]